MPPAASMPGRSAGSSKPRPSSRFCPSARSTAVFAEVSSNHQSGRAVTAHPADSTPPPTSRTIAPTPSRSFSAQRHSAGSRRSSRSATSSRGTTAASKRPAATSIHATPQRTSSTVLAASSPAVATASAARAATARGTIATSQLRFVGSSNDSSDAMPGVTIRVTSRRRMPLVGFPSVEAGPSICSQMATRRPTATSFTSCTSSWWCGKPAIGRASGPLSRLVSVRSRRSAASRASSPKSS